MARLSAKSMVNNGRLRTAPPPGYTSPSVQLLLRKLSGPHTDTWTGLGWTSKGLPPRCSRVFHRKAASSRLLRPPGPDPPILWTVASVIGRENTVHMSTVCLFLIKTVKQSTKTACGHPPGWCPQAVLAAEVYRFWPFSKGPDMQNPRDCRRFWPSKRPLCSLWFGRCIDFGLF